MKKNFLNFAAASMAFVAIALFVFACPSSAQDYPWNDCNPGKEIAFSAGPYGTDFGDTGLDSGSLCN